MLLRQVGKIFAPPIFEDEDKNYVASMLNVLLPILLVAAIPGVILQILRNDLITTLGIGIGAMVVLAAYVMMRRGHLTIPRYLVPILTLVLFTYLPITASGLHAITLLGLFITIVLAGLFLEKNATILFGVLASMGATLIYAAERIGLRSYPILDGPAELANVITIIMAFSILLRVLISKLDNSLQRARQSEAEVRKLNEVLEARVAERTQDLEKARQEAEEARTIAEQASETKSRFLANMSHELRTPLNAILNFTEFVSEGIYGAVNEKQVHALQQALSSGTHLLGLINDVLDITKIEAGMMELFIEEVDFNAVLASAVSVGKGLVKDKPIKLITEIDEDLPKTFGDNRRLRQVFLNLVSNSAKFTKQGSITITASRQGDGIEVIVQDTGIGIAPEDYDKVFETFKQAKHNLIGTVGTGLGMPISRHFIEMHGGQIRFESQPNVGTTFNVHLPSLTEEQMQTISQSASELVG